MNDFKLSVLTAPLGKTHLFSVGQAGFIIKSASGQLLGIDLYLSDCVERVEGHNGYKRLLPKILTPDDVDFVAVIATHHHRDHFDIDSLPIIVSNGAKLLAAYDCEEDIIDLGLSYYNPLLVKPGDNILCGDFKMTFTRCDHGAAAPKSVGVIVEVDGKRIFEIGDSCKRLDFIEKYKGMIDVVIGPINGKYGNMDESDFPEIAHELDALAIPCHFGMFPSHGGNPGRFREIMLEKYPDDKFIIMAQGERYTF